MICRNSIIVGTVVLLGSSYVNSAPLGVDREVGGIMLREGPQDMVQVSQNEWAFVSGPERFPVLSVTLSSGRFTYEIRHDRKYGNGAIGLSRPTQANWYQAGMLDLFINGRRFDLHPDNKEHVELLSGKHGKAIFVWETDVARVRYTFVLLSGDNKLFLDIDLEPKVEVKELSLRLQNYVAGFNHTPKHVLHTPVRVLDKNGWQDVNPVTENAIFYSDASLDVATNPKSAGPSALAFANAEVAAAKVCLGGYGVSTHLACTPTARHLRLCFWEFPKKANAVALDAFRSALPKVMEMLN